MASVVEGDGEGLEGGIAGGDGPTSPTSKHHVSKTLGGYLHDLITNTAKLLMGFYYFK